MQQGKVLFKDAKIAIYKHPIKGFCVIANKNLKKDEHVMTSPVSVLDDYGDIKKSCGLDVYPMFWDKNHDCIAFGYINLLNHDSDSNIRLEQDKKNLLFKAFAKRNIKKGEELTINYRCKLWFSEIKEKLFIKLI
jgi:hypothetical protein